MTEHDTDSLDCPCGPEFLFPCDEHPFEDRCWKCETRNGLIPMSRAEADACDYPIIVVHREDV